MKRLWNVLVLTLAVNFLVLAGGVGWLYRNGQLDRAKVLAIRELLFPVTQPVAATQPVEAASTTQPALRLEELLAQYAGRPPSDQLEYIRRSFDSQMAQLERSHRELLALQQQVESAQQKVGVDRAQLSVEAKKLAEREQQAQKLATEKGFQDSLALYQSLPPRQVKTIFMGLDDQTIIQYLQAMESRTSAKITKEFKSKEELERLKLILEKMRQSSVAVKD